MSFIENRADDIIYMTSPNLAAVHAFTTRRGGGSRGIFRSLNLGQALGDAPEDVAANYAAIFKALGITDTRAAYNRQIHGRLVRAVTAADLLAPYEGVPPQADALITNSPDVPLMVFIADCVPILLHDPVCGAVGAVHAGWRGTALDIAGGAVRAMVSSLGCAPEDIRAAIGPCISRCCFETGREVYEAVSDVLGRAAENCCTPRGDKYMVDLPEVNRLLLLRAGLRSVEVSGECTSCGRDKYWSHRATGGIRGSQAAIITLKGTSS